MTIRYKCHSCGSTLNIKSELAGTAGKCPKCKVEFTVPDAEPATSAEKEGQVAATSQTAAEGKAAPEKDRPRSRAKLARKPAATAKASAEDPDFDPVAFLMTDDSSAPSPPASDVEAPATLELEESDDEDRRRRSRARRRVDLDPDAEIELDSASATAGAMLSGGASAGAARDLLTRTVEESRARATRMDDEETADYSEAKEIARELAIRGLPGLLGIVLVAWGLHWLVNSVVGGGLDLPDLGSVSGIVTLDGEPLAGARVMFTPTEREMQLSENKTIRLRSSNAITDENGHYELEYIEGISGAAVGEHRVIISKMDGPRDLAPAEYGPLSMVIRAVDHGSNDFDFPLIADSPRRPR